MTILGAPDQDIRLSFRATLAEAEATWEASAGPTDAAGFAEVGISLPPEAWLHGSAASYVTDLRLRVTVGEASALAPPTVIAWPDGPDGAPVLWTVQEAETLAPNGVLDAALREGLPPNVRALPDVSDQITRTVVRRAIDDSGVSR